jgi:hypothetical protein
MPNKYEREIEEILRNMDRTEPSPSIGDRIRAFNRPGPRARPASPRFVLRMRAQDALLVIGIILALIGAGISFYFSTSQTGTGLLAYVAGILGVLALASLLAGLIVGWRARFRPTPVTSWRGERPTSIHHFRPVALVATQVRIMRLKWRYWRTRGK